MGVRDAVQLLRAAPGALFGSLSPQSVFGMFGGYVAWGKPPARGTKEIMLLYKRSPWFRAAASRMSFGVAQQDWKLYAGKAKGSEKFTQRKDVQRAANPAHRRKLLGEAARNGELEEITNHPLLDLLETFNPLMPGLAARALMQTVMDLKGEVFLVIERNAHGMPIQLWPMPPYWVSETPSLQRPTFRVSAVGWTGEIPETEVIWIRDLDPENPYGRGVGIGDALADEADTDEYAAKYTKSFYYNDALPAGMVGIEGVSRKEQLDEAKQRWEDDHKGFLKSFKLHFHSGKLNFVQISPNFDPQKHTDLRKFERDAILQVYGMPPEILGILEHSNRATIDAADLILSRYGLVPRLEVLRAFFQLFLVPQFDERLILDYESPVQEDREFKIKAVQVAPWAFTTNEIRKAAGEPPDGKPESDELPDRPSGAPQMLGPDGQPAAKPDAARLLRLERVALARRRAHVTKADEDEVDHILEELRPQYLTSETQAEYQSRIHKWAGDVLSELAQDPNFSLLNPKVTEFVNEFSLSRLGDVNMTTKDALRGELIDGIKAGEGIDDLAKRVEDVFADAEGYRAERIARTEVTRGANFASNTAYKISGVVESKEWVATEDGRERDSHAEMDGQVVGVDGEFTSPDGGTADYPGDFGDPEEDINCRCAVAPVISDPGDGTEEDAAPAGRTKATQGHWKRFEAKATPWEASMRSDLRRGFAKQKTKVLEALHRVRGGR